jgi:hypothetical protein
MSAQTTIAKLRAELAASNGALFAVARLADEQRVRAILAEEQVKSIVDTVVFGNWTLP